MLSNVGLTLIKRYNVIKARATFEFFLVTQVRNRLLCCDVWKDYSQFCISFKP